MDEMPTIVSLVPAFWACFLRGFRVLERFWRRVRQVPESSGRRVWEVVLEGRQGGFSSFGDLSGEVLKTRFWECFGNVPNKVPRFLKVPGKAHPESTYKIRRPTFCT